MLESVRDANGKVVAENFYSKEELEDHDNERKYGGSRNHKDLREVLKANKPVGKFVVLKSRKLRNLSSRFYLIP